MKKIIFVLLIGVWILLSTGVVFINMTKTITEYRTWGGLSDSAKREKIFGDLYTFYKLVNANTTSGAEILLFSSDGMAYYFSRYYLYPKKIDFLNDQPTFMTEVSTKKYEYIALYDNEQDLIGYKKIASLSGKTKGGVYKKE